MKNRITALEPITVIRDPKDLNSVIRTIPKGEEFSFHRRVIRAGSKFYQLKDEVTKETSYIQDDLSIGLWKHGFVSNTSVTIFTYKILKEKDEDANFYSYVQPLKRIDAPPSGHKRFELKITEGYEDNEKIEYFKAFSYDPTEISILSTSMLTGEKLDISPIQEIGMDDFYTAYRKNGKPVFIPKEVKISTKESSNSLLIIGILTVITIIYLGNFLLKAGFTMKGKAWILIALLIAGGIFIACSIIVGFLRGIYKQIEMRF